MALSSKPGSTADAQKRTLKIKASAVKRLIKDKALYLAELSKQQKHIEELVSQNAEGADIRKQKEVLEETLQMIPHIESRIKNSLEDLENHLASADSELKTAQEYVDAKAVVEEAAKALPEDVSNNNAGAVAAVGSQEQQDSKAE
ncbi:hypothetical protein H4R99_002463 [Coemansia sp. RSA 1722]|nr:hypothetical protein LPJ57_006431 [Coemansia sp. RSA 486]KAJ2603116.1 hypothetical protein H4R99_002463 [Coemansia sp. RSA 1722]